MEFELDADPEDPTLLAGLKLPGALREGRARTQSVNIVWHDSPDHALLHRGMTLVERRGDWRVERVVPSMATWLPGQPPVAVEQAEERGSLTTELPSPLAPIAAFVGRRSISIYRFPVAEGATVAATKAPPATTPPTKTAGDEAPSAQVAPAQVTPPQVTVAIERGMLRSVTAERPIARIVLSGDEAGVRATALRIAVTMRAWVPRASLAAQAIALATGGAAQPRHLGAPVLPEADIGVTDALAHILGHLLDVILHHAPTAALPASRPAGSGVSRRDGPAADGPPANGPLHRGQMEAVHQMRVAVRRALSAVSVFREVLPEGTLDPVHGGLRALGASLGQTRDWDVFVAETAPTIAASLPPDERLDRLIAAARRRQRECRKMLSEYLMNTAFRVLAVELCWFAAAAFWRSGGTLQADDQTRDGLEDPEGAPDEKSIGPMEAREFAPRVLQQRWKKLISAGKNIEDLDVASLHRVRLRAKRARYAAEMFALPHNSKAAQRFIHRLSILQQRLGVLNDGAVAAHLLQQLGGPSGRHAYAVGVVVGFTASRAGRIRPRIVRAFERFRRQPTYWA